MRSSSVRFARRRFGCGTTGSPWDSGVYSTGSLTEIGCALLELRGAVDMQLFGSKHEDVPLLAVQVPVLDRESPRRLVPERYLFPTRLAGDAAGFVLVLCRARGVWGWAGVAGLLRGLAGRDTGALRRRFALLRDPT